MHAMQKRIFQGHPRPFPYFLLDPGTCLDQARRLRVRRDAADARWRKGQLPGEEWVRIRRVGNVDFAHVQAIKEQGVLRGRPRQIVVENPRASPYYRPLPTAWRVRQREPRREIFAVIERVLPIVAQAKCGTEVWQNAHRILRIGAGLLRAKRNARNPLIDLEEIRRPRMVLNDVAILIQTAECKRPSEVCRLEGVPPVIPERRPEHQAVLSTDVGHRILRDKPAHLFAIKRLGWSADKRPVRDNLRSARGASRSAFLVLEKEEGLIAQSWRKRYAVQQLRAVCVPARAESLLRKSKRSHVVVPARLVGKRIIGGQRMHLREHPLRSRKQVVPFLRGRYVNIQRPG